MLAHAHEDVHATAIAEFFAGLGGGPVDAEEASAGTPAATANYIICFVNRSGSNLLAAALQSTGTMGNPRECFNAPEVIEVSRERGHRSLAAYTRAVMRSTSTPNGVFGMKLGVGQLLYLTRERIVPAIVSRPRFIYVTRRDTVAQAVSFVIAAQTGLWTSREPWNGRSPRYDAEAIVANLRWIYESQGLFEYYFTIHDIHPLRFAYEDFEGGVEAPVARIATALGLPAPRCARDRIELRRQRTALNEEFKARFLAEARAGW